MISIVIATFNRGHLICDTLESIKNQKFEEFECLIIDDQSRDNSENVIKEFIKGDNRFIYRKRSNEHRKGLPGCRNYGITLTKGDYILFFDDDDIMHPNCLLHNYNLLKDNTYDFSRFERVTFIDKSELNYKEEKMIIGAEINKLDLYRVITNALPMNSCQVVWSKHCFSSVKFNEELMYAEEWEAYIRIISQDFKGICLDTTLMFARKHLKSNTGEYWLGVNSRINSHIKAIELILSYLNENGVLDFKSEKYLLNRLLSLKDLNSVKRKIREYHKGMTLWLWIIYFEISPIRNYIYKKRK